MKEARFYKTINPNEVQCFLCPHHCRIGESEAGRCRVRINKGGTLMAMSYGLVSALHSDPVEKKPLYHFFPGKKILSIGSYSCNLRCSFCQNWEISQTFPDFENTSGMMDLKQIISKTANERDNIGIAFTYNEPVVNYESVIELAAKAKSSGLKTAMITNGYIAENPLNELLPLIDAFNVDLKVFSNPIYKSFTGGSLNPVLRTLKAIKKNGNHLEISHLLVTGMNDHSRFFDPMVDWIAKELGEPTVLHISRYFPNYQISHAPTSPSVLSYMFEKARRKLFYVYLGNIILPGTADTFCHNCQAKLIERHAYQTQITGLNQHGACISCGQAVIKHI